MRTIVFLPFLLLALTSCTPKAAVFGTETGQFGASFDHYAINVDDLDASVAFYQKVLSLEEIYDGTEKDNIRWLSLGNGQCRSSTRSCSTCATSTCSSSVGRAYRWNLTAGLMGFGRFTLKIWMATGWRLMMRGRYC